MKDHCPIKSCFRYQLNVRVRARPELVKWNHLKLRRAKEDHEVRGPFVQELLQWTRDNQLTVTNFNELAADPTDSWSFIHKALQSIAVKHFAITGTRPIQKWMSEATWQEVQRKQAYVVMGLQATDLAIKRDRASSGDIGRAFRDVVFWAWVSRFRV